MNLINLNYFKMNAYSLLEKKGNQITGAMSPMLIAQEISKHFKLKIHGLARINFDNQETWQKYEKGEGLTGYDHLAMLTRWKNNKSICIFIDIGIGALPVALKFKDESKNKLIISQVYKNEQFADTLNEDQIKNLLTYLFENETEVFEIPEKKPTVYKALINEEILKDRTDAFNSHSGARVGDYLKLPDGQYTRFTHLWEDSIQTGGTEGGSYYLGNSGNLSYSGGLDPGVKLSDIEETTERKKGSIWFFDKDISGAGRGVYNLILCKVFKLKENADISGLRELKR